MEIAGKLVSKEDAKSWTDSFKSRKFVVETPGDYPQFISCELHQDKCSLLDGVGKGADLKLSVDLRGRQYTGKDGVVKYFNTVVCFKLEVGVAVKEPVSDDLPF